MKGNSIDQSELARLKELAENSDDLQVLEVSLEEVRQHGGIQHLGLPKDVEDSLMEQLVADGVFTTH